MLRLPGTGVKRRDRAEALQRLRMYSDAGSGRFGIIVARQWQITTRRPVWLPQPCLAVFVTLYDSFNFHLFVVQRHDQPWVKLLRQS